MSATFFKTATEFRAWFKKHHVSQTELLVGLYSKSAGKGGITYAEALDEALCYGWIDGVRKNRDSESYTIRFTPRKKNGIWSLVNVRHIERLTTARRMATPGIKAFEARRPEKTGVYSFEQKSHAFEPAQEMKFRAKKKAWAFWEAQPPGYRRLMIHWVTSAKKEETRLRRLTALVEHCAGGLRVIQ